MINKESPADYRSRVDLYPRQPATQMGDHPGQPLQSHMPQTVGDTVKKQGMDPRIGGQYLKGIPRSRIALEDTLDVLFPVRSFFLW
jgi:hypothetical protein